MVPLRVCTDDFIRKEVCMVASEYNRRNLNLEPSVFRDNENIDLNETFFDTLCAVHVLQCEDIRIIRCGLHEFALRAFSVPDDFFIYDGSTWLRPEIPLSVLAFHDERPIFNGSFALDIEKDIQLVSASVTIRTEIPRRNSHGRFRYRQIFLCVFRHDNLFFRFLRLEIFFRLDWLFGRLVWDGNDIIIRKLNEFLQNNRICLLRIIPFRAYRNFLERHSFNSCNVGWACRKIITGKELRALLRPELDERLSENVNLSVTSLVLDFLAVNDIFIVRKIDSDSVRALPLFLFH